MLVPANAPYDICYWIKELINNDNLRESLSNNAVFTAKERHNPQTIVKNILEVYQSILKKITMAKISILTPVYNAANYIGNAINSVLEQSFTDWEMLCVDDESTDNSLAILCEYQKKDKRIKVFLKRIQAH